MAVVAFSQRREAQDGGIIQRSTGCCRGQSSGKGQWCSSTPEPAKAGAAQIRCRCVPPHARMPRCSYPWSCAHCRCSILMLSWTGTHSAEGAFTPLSLSGLNETCLDLHLTANGTSAPPSAPPLAASRFTSPYTSNGVQVPGRLCQASHCPQVWQQSAWPFQWSSWTRDAHLGPVGACRQRRIRSSDRFI